MRIAIVKLSALGDIIHAMVVLQFIKKFNPRIEIDWIVEESYKNLLELNSHIDNIHTVNLKKAKKRKSIYLLLNEIFKARKFGKYDLIIDMQGLVKSALISRVMVSKNTLGFDKMSIRESFASIFYNQTFNCDYKKNIIERNFELIKFAIGFNNSSDEILKKIPFLYSNNNFYDRNISKTKKNIILIPGASHKSKRIPINKFIELTQIFDANYIIIWGNSKEKELAQKIQIASPNVNISDKLSLCDLIMLVTHIDLVIGPDTGPTHVAWALNVPSITLFGPTPGYRNTYKTSINKIIESNSSVNPLKINLSDDSIKNIEVSEIVKLSKFLLESK